MKQNETLRQLLNWRHFAIAALFTASVLLICSECTAQSEAAFTIITLAKTAAGFAAAYAACRLTARWHREGKVPMISEMMKGEEL